MINDYLLSITPSVLLITYSSPQNRQWKREARRKEEDQKRGTSTSTAFHRDHVPMPLCHCTRTRAPGHQGTRPYRVIVIDMNLTRVQRPRVHVSSRKTLRLIRLLAWSCLTELSLILVPWPRSETSGSLVSARLPVLAPMLPECHPFQVP